MNEPYRLAIPIPPLLTAYYQNAKRRNAAGKEWTGRMISPEGQRFKGEVMTEVRRGHRRPPKLSGPLSIICLLCKPTKTKAGARSTNRKGDLDNRWKALLDALTDAEVILDDVQFDDTRMIRGNPVDGGRLYLAISRFDPDASLAAAAAFGLPFAPSYGPGTAAAGHLPF